MKGRIIKNPQLNVFRVPLVSVVNLEHELVLLSHRIDWEKVDKEFSIYYPELGRPAVPIRRMVGSMLLKQMYNLGGETLVARWIENPKCCRVLGTEQLISSMTSHMIRVSLLISVNGFEKREHRK